MLLYTKTLTLIRSFAYSIECWGIISRTKLRPYSIYIFPVLTYASETWTLSKSDENLLAAFERKMLRRILGPVCEEGQWRSRYNGELYEMYEDITVLQRIKLARLRWAGHVVRMEPDDPARKVFLGRPQGQRRRGRPKLRWQEGVEASAIKAGITDWQSKVRDPERVRKMNFVF